MLSLTSYYTEFKKEIAFNIARAYLIYVGIFLLDLLFSDKWKL